MLPPKALRAIAALMEQAGFDFPARTYAGFAVLFSLLMGAAVFALAHFSVARYNTATSLAIALGVFAALQALFYGALFVSAEARAKRIEEVLADALQNISANIRAGMTIENAIWTSARPEFGPLEDEIKRVSGETYGGKPITNALNGMARRVRSKVLERAIRLINEGISLGGEMAHLLDEVAADVRGARQLRKEIANATLMYSMFIVFASVMIAPVLFSVSVYYAEMNEKMMKAQGDTKMPASKGGYGSLSATFTQKRSLTITPADVKNFSIAAIAISTAFSALTLSMIRNGRLSPGFKLVPVFVFVALGLFFASHALLSTMLKIMG